MVKNRGPQCPLVANTMSHAKFEIFKQHIQASDSENLQKGDKMAKINIHLGLPTSPLSQFGIILRSFSLYGQTVLHFGQHSGKMLWKG